MSMQVYYLFVHRQSLIKFEPFVKKGVEISTLYSGYQGNQKLW